VLLSPSPLHHLSKSATIIFNIEKGSEGSLIIITGRSHELFANLFIAIDYCGLEMVKSNNV
jgi:hypothetical protein